MSKKEPIDIDELRRRVFPTLSPEEREEAGRILREYLAVCARIYERAKAEGTWPWPENSDDSTKSGL